MGSFLFDEIHAFFLHLAPKYTKSNNELSGAYINIIHS